MVEKIFETDLFDPFILDDEELDALRMEVQAFSPEKQKKFEKVFEDVVDIACTLFWEKFGQMFSQQGEPTLENLESMKKRFLKRFVLMDEETMKTFTDHWPGTKVDEEPTQTELAKMKELSLSFEKFAQANGLNSQEPSKENIDRWLASLPEDERDKFTYFLKTNTSHFKESYLPQDSNGTFRAYGSEGNFVVGIPVDLWDKLADSNKAELIKDNNGSKEDARKFFQQVTWLNYVLHEMTHLLQVKNDASIPLWLIEMQSAWLAREVVPEKLRFYQSDLDARADAYQELINKYKDLNQALFDLKKWGRNHATIYNVKQDMQSERIKELFPHYQER